MEILFNNRHIHDFPQWHFVKSGLPVDELVLQTGMVTSKSQLKRLQQQGAVYVEERPDLSNLNVVRQIRIGQRRLLLTN